LKRDLGAQERLDAAFAREERRGLMVAAVARSAAVVSILGVVDTLAERDEPLGRVRRG